ncbi:DUF3265 domain-containing protein [Vibrio pomeroyi]|nr:DUF3265 domain-containing protein [uncultured Vibrio sp.]
MLLTNCLRVIRNAWHFSICVVVCSVFCIALLTPLLGLM